MNSIARVDCSRIDALAVIARRPATRHSTRHGHGTMMRISFHHARTRLLLRGKKFLHEVWHPDARHKRRRPPTIHPM